MKVVAYVPNDSMDTGSAGPKNMQTGEKASVDDVVADWQKMYDYAQQQFGTYQLWGRKVDMEVVTASGADEAAQRADALEVINRKPFMVVDVTGTATGGAPVFATTVAGRKILTVSSSTTSEIGAKQSPYRWNYGADPDAGTPLTAAFVGRSLSGKKAQWAGDKGLQSKTRALGIVYPTTGFDLAEFQRLVKQDGGPAIAQAVNFDPDDTSHFTDQAQTLVTRLKSSGVTTVILFADPSMTTPLTKAATDQEYFPEWIITGYGYHDYDLFAESYDQKQASHMFGLSVLFPYISGAPDYLDSFTWFWGKNQGNTWSIAPGLFGFTYGAIQYAGPTLTADNVKKGLFSVPATGGAATGTVTFQAGYGKTVGMPYDEYSQLGSDRALAWYDPDASGQMQAANLTGKGLFQYMDGGKRYSYKNLPKSEPKFFDKSKATTEVPITSQFTAGGSVPAATPCTQCPSNGGAA